MKGLEMKSPVGRRPLLEETTLDEGLVAYACPEGGGVYITLQNYWDWLKLQPERLEHLPDLGQGSCLLEDEPKAKLCPETGTIMIRCRVGHGFKFYIDRSRTGGVWLDAGEWDALRARNFHDEIHLIFTKPWQSEIRAQRAERMNKKILHDKVGDDLLAEIQSLKERLREHPHRDYVFAYLEEK